MSRSTDGPMVKAWFPTKHVSSVQNPSMVPSNTGWFIGFLYCVIIIPDILDSIIPELIINKQGFRSHCSTVSSHHIFPLRGVDLINYSYIHWSWSFCVQIQFHVMLLFVDGAIPWRIHRHEELLHLPGSEGIQVTCVLMHVSNQQFKQWEPNWTCHILSEPGWLHDIYTCVCVSDSMCMCKATF